jgi:O-glycosyl hydrolase
MNRWLIVLKRCCAFLFLVGAIVPSLTTVPARATNIRPKSVAKVEFGIDRSNMSTEWTLSPPAEPNIYPFNGPYNGAGVFEARRVAVFDGIARLRPQWFRDGFGPDTPEGPQLFVDMVKQVHARGMKILAVVSHTASDFDKKDYIDPTESGCQWGTYPLSEIDLAKFEHRVRRYFGALKQAGLSVDAFEIGNEFDLNCNDADMPKTSDFAAHHWQWFLTREQVHKFAFLKTFTQLIREYFPSAKVITFGMSNPTGNSAALIQALASFTDSSGKTFDYTTLVDGYGTHIYSPADTTANMINRATEELNSQAAMLPYSKEKPIWITEWNEAAAAFWSSKSWYFQPTGSAPSTDDKNKAQGEFPAMTRVEVIRVFHEEVVDYLRSLPNPVNIGYVFYYSYHSAGKFDMCDGTAFNSHRGIKGTCFSGVIDPVTGSLLPDIAAAVMSQTSQRVEESNPASPPAADSIPEALRNAGRILPRPAQTFRGWGMSLAWEANDLYGGGRQPAQIKDPKIQNEYMDLLYGDPDTRLTLGFTVARYNIGGGDDPTHMHMRADAQMEGYQSGPGTAFDWTRDAPQRRMLQEAKKRGANIFEAASYSPPYWMTLSGCSSGNKAGQREDNLLPEMRESFVSYLATVVKHFPDVEGIRFESLEPFNEPDISWGAGGRQEGYAASLTTRNAVIPMLAARLKRDGLDTFVSGVDMNNIGSAVGNAEQMESGALSSLGQFNTHDYHSNPYWVLPQRFKELSRMSHKPVWMSELGCCFPGQGDKTEIWGALFLADSIRADLRDLGAEVWVLWQPDWNVIAFDPKGGEPQLKKQYYALAQYTRFIRPGFQIISAGGAYNTLAAYSGVSKRLILVSTNWDAVALNDLDLTAFDSLPSSITVFRTSADEGVNLQQGKGTISANGHIVDPLPIRSITTYILDGVRPRSILPSNAVTIEGTHQIASEATKLCMNIAGNSTIAGDAIIPYPCGGFSNMEFNLVDRGGGFYSIHTVNGPTSLCLNISNATAAPGGGKTPGGPGNLIQWNCGQAAIPANELFEIINTEAGRVRIRVKASGLCLEDPGRGGTIRQNRCVSSSLHQSFVLTE